MEVFEINGKTYEKIVKDPQQKKSHGSSRMMSMLMPYMMMASMMYGGGSAKEKSRPDVDIVEEFALIQQKKSKLSKSERDWVEKMFHKNFKEVQICQACGNTGRCNPTLAEPDGCECECGINKNI